MTITKYSKKKSKEYKYKAGIKASKLENGKKNLN